MFATEGCVALGALFRPIACLPRLLLLFLASREVRDDRSSRVSIPVCLHPTTASIDAPLLTWCRIYFPQHDSETQRVAV